MSMYDQSAIANAADRRAEKYRAERDRLYRVLAHLCIDPDEVGRSCGECLGCRMVAAAKRQEARCSNPSEGER